MKSMISVLALMLTLSSAEDPACDFERNLCEWRQSKSDQFDWTRKSGRTASSNTGPSSGHGGKGYYIYIETSSPRRPNDKAVLTLKGGSYQQPMCLSFFYHMYGRYINRLNVYNRGALVWSKVGQQGNAWKKAEVPITRSVDLKIEGIRGRSWTGDIAIDDILLSAGSCGSVIPTTPTPTPTLGPTVVPGSCGASPVTRVIGGIDAQPGNWPWQIALLRGSSKSFSCGGSLIAPDWIVTAAHCISSLSGSYYTIRLGDHDRYSNEGTEEDIPGKRVIRHPGYNNPSPINNDIALIQLARPAKLSARVGTVCLPAHQENVPSSAKCYITGWGKIKHPGSSHRILQQAVLPPVANDICAKKLAASPGAGRLRITDQMICAGKEGTNLSGCHGDSGGPYVCQSANGKWFLQGAVSWGSPRCSAQERYTVFARVAQFRNWINGYVRV
ncbi:chymotrypsinogen B-like isoform X2 [Porites lutea]|uniref:chymotrypsinogen B-like isoform X2 n=1 Tax=Porites lutea TaxID=51062 RepID=UPI003CC522DE